jgi:hypothetical protein
VYPGAAKKHLEQRIPLSRGTLEMRKITQELRTITQELRTITQELRTITQELRTILGEVEVDDPWKCGRILRSRGGDLGT